MDKESDILQFFQDARKKGALGPIKKIIYYHGDYFFYLLLCILLSIFFIILSAAFLKNGQIYSSLITNIIFIFFFTLSFFILTFTMGKIGLMQDLFFSHSKIKNQLNENLRNIRWNLSDVRRLQKEINYFDKSLFLVLKNDLKKYKEIWTYKLYLKNIARNSYCIHYLIITGIEKNQNTSLIKDFTEYIKDLRAHILIPLLEKKITIIVVDTYFKKSRSEFKLKHKQLYIEIDNHLEEFYKMMETKHLRLSDLKNIIILAISTIGASILASVITLLF